MNGGVTREDHLSAALQRLADSGCTLELDQVALIEGGSTAAVPGRLIRQGTVARVSVAVVSELTLSAARDVLRAAPERPLLLLGPEAHERSAEAFRKTGVFFVDRAGNAFIDSPGIYVDVRGRRAEHRGEPMPAKPHDVNLFTRRRAQVVFAVLQWPKLLELPIRHVATTAGVSVGQAQSTLTALSDAGFLLGSDVRRLYDEGRLLDEFVATFPRSIGAARHQREFSGAPLQLPLDQGTPVDVKRSGEAAVPELIRGETATYYIAGFTAKFAAVNRWRGGTRPNIVVRELFWSDPIFDMQVTDRAPSVLVYADLLASGDSREAEAAREFRATDERLRTI